MRKKYYWIVVIVAIVIIALIGILIFVTYRLPEDIPKSCDLNCAARFKEWCNYCLIVKASEADSYPLPSDISSCIVLCNPINMPLPQNKTCSSMSFMCSYFVK